MNAYSNGYRNGGERMTKTKKQLRAEAVERLKNCVAARFDAESIVIALTSGRHGQSDWSLECDKLIYLLTDDDSTISEVDSTAERGMTNLEWLYEHDEYFNSFAKLIAFLRGFSTDEFTANEWLRQEHYEPNPDCSAMLYRMYTENMKHEPCSHYEPKDDVSGYGADFNVAEPNFDNIKAVEMDASRLVAREPDSREKLEADIWSGCEHLTMVGAGEKLVNVPYGKLLEWLDRQEIITLTETHKRERELGEAFDGLTEQIAELTAERDRLQAQVDRLTAELEKATNNLNSANEDFENARAELTAERDELKAELIYRSKFGKCLDYADVIHTLIDDEGLA